MFQILSSMVGNTQKESPEGIEQVKQHMRETLMRADVPASNSSAWRPLFTTKINTYGLAELIPFAEVRNLRRSRPATLASLIFNCIRIIDRTSALALGLERYIGADRLNSSEDLFTSQLFFTQQEYEVELSRNKARRNQEATPTTPDQEGRQSISNSSSTLTVVEPPRDFCDIYFPERRAFDNALALLRLCVPITFEEGGQQIDSNNNTNGGESAFADGFKKQFYMENCTMHSSTATFTEATKPLGEILINVLTRCAHMPGFCNANGQRIDGMHPLNHPAIHSSLVWASGVGGQHKTIAWENSETVAGQRQAVLDTILTTLSGLLYGSSAGNSDIALDTITDPKRCPLGSTLTCSLLNLVCSYSTRGSLPFSSHLIGKLEQLVFTSTALLNVLLSTDKFHPNQRFSLETHQPLNGVVLGSAVPSFDNGKPTPDLADLVAPNLETYATFVMRHYHTAWPVLLCASGSEVHLVLKGVVDLLCNRTYAKTTKVPGTQRSLSHHDEFILLINKVLRCPNFFEAIADTPEIAQAIVIPMLDYAVNVCRHPIYYVQGQVVVQTLLRLSNHRDFSIALAEPLGARSVPASLTTMPMGSYADLVVFTMLQILNVRQQADGSMQAEALRSGSSVSDLASSHSLIKQPASPLHPDALKEQSKHTAIMSMHEGCACVISNITPHMTSMSDHVSLFLMSFFFLATRPEWLVLHPSYPTVLQLIVESIANLLQYQYRSAPVIMYNLCRERTRLHQIAKEIARPLQREASKRAAQQFVSNASMGSRAAIESEPGSPFDLPAPREREDASPYATEPTITSAFHGGAIYNPYSNIETAAAMGAPTERSEMESAADRMAEEADNRKLTLSSDSVIPMAVRRSILMSTLVAAVEAAEPALFKAIAKDPKRADPISILKKSSLVGLLPRPHEICLRLVLFDKDVDTWINYVLWLFIFSNERRKKIGDPERVTLFGGFTVPKA